MSDTLFRLRALFTLGLLRRPIVHIFAWKEYVWDVDLNAQICCNGYMCGCQGVSNYKYIEYMWLGIK